MHNETSLLSGCFPQRLCSTGEKWVTTATLGFPIGKTKIEKTVFQGTGGLIMLVRVLG